MKEKKKSWFMLMITNMYFVLFVVFACILTWQVLNLSLMVGIVMEEQGFIKILAVLGMLIPLAITALCVFKGFVQFWNNYKNGDSR